MSGKEKNLTHFQLKKKSPLPLYMQVKEYIQDMINSGQWATGMRIPSENEVVRQMGVSRMTANRALRELTAEGYLHRLQGVGTFVAEPTKCLAMIEIRSIKQEIENRGGRHSCQTILLKEEIPPKDILFVFGMPEKTMVFHAIFLHKDGDFPIQMSKRWVNPVVAPDFLKQDFTKITASEYLCQIAPVSFARHTIEAAMPGKATQKLLQMRESEPCLILHRVVNSQNRIATVNQFIFPASRYKLASTYTPGLNDQAEFA